MVKSRVQWLSLLLYTGYWFALSIIDVPNIAIVERAICIQHYQDPFIDEAACKRSDIQVALASTLGWKLTFNSLAGLLTVLYYGHVAEQQGKKLVLFLSICGYMAMVALDVLICSLPFTFSAQTIWLSSALLLIGGGQRVYTSLIYALVADSLESDQTTTQLYLLGLGSNVVKLIDPRIAAGLMQINLLAPFCLSYIAFAAVLILITLVVEGNLPKPKQRSEGYTAIPSRESVDESPIVAADRATTSSPTASDHKPLGGKADKKSAAANLKCEIEVFYSLFSTAATFYCLAAMFFKRIGFASSVFAPQYVSDKFKWSLHQTTWLRVSGSGAAVLVYLIAPPMNAWLIKKGSLPSTVDMNTIRGSLLVLAFSFIAAWRARSGVFMIVATFGMGLGETLQPALQGFVTFATGSQRNTRVFTMLAVADTAAELVAGPFTAALMAIGRTDDHPSNGLCFLASSAIFAVLLFWTFLFKGPHVA